MRIVYFAWALFFCKLWADNPCHFTVQSIRAQNDTVLNNQFDADIVSIVGLPTPIKFAPEGYGVAYFSYKLGSDLHGALLFKDDFAVKRKSLTKAESFGVITVTLLELVKPQPTQYIGFIQVDMQSDNQHDFTHIGDTIKNLVVEIEKKHGTKDTVQWITTGIFDGNTIPDPAVIVGETGFQNIFTYGTNLYQRYKDAKNHITYESYRGGVDRQKFNFVALEGPTKLSGADRPSMKITLSLPKDVQCDFAADIASKYKQLDTDQGDLPGLLTAINEKFRKLTDSELTNAAYRYGYQTTVGAAQIRLYFKDAKTVSDMMTVVFLADLQIPLPDSNPLTLEVVLKDGADINVFHNGEFLPIQELLGDKLIQTLDVQKKQDSVGQRIKAAALLLNKVFTDPLLLSGKEPKKTASIKKTAEIQKPQPVPQATMKSKVPPAPPLPTTTTSALRKVTPPTATPATTAQPLPQQPIVSGQPTIQKQVHDSVAPVPKAQTVVNQENILAILDALARSLQELASIAPVAAKPQATTAAAPQTIPASAPQSTADRSALLAAIHHGTTLRKVSKDQQSTLLPQGRSLATLLSQSLKERRDFVKPQENSSDEWSD